MSRTYDCRTYLLGCSFNDAPWYFQFNNILFVTTDLRKIKIFCAVLLRVTQRLFWAKKTLGVYREFKEVQWHGLFFFSLFKISPTILILVLNFLTKKKSQTLRKSQYLYCFENFKSQENFELASKLFLRKYLFRYHCSSVWTQQVSL